MNIRNKRYIIIGTSIAVLVVTIVLVNVIPYMLYGFIIAPPTFIDGETRQENTYREINYTELSKEQRLEDFDYLFDMIKTSLPYVYDMEEKYNFSVLDKEEEYRAACAACEDDYSFLALMTSIVNDIPSGHAAVVPPDYYSYFLSGYYRSNTVGLNLTDNMQGKLDAYGKYLVEKQSEYNKKLESAVYFSYTDGVYLCYNTEDTDNYSTIISINGDEPQEFVTGMMSPIGEIQYDAKYDCPYRSDLMFSTTGTQPVTLRLKSYDGTEYEEQYYCDYDLCYAYDMAWYYSDEVYDYITEDGELFETPPDAEDDAVIVYTDEENDIAYLSISSLHYSDGTDIKEKISEYSGYDNIVIDLRGNGGGISTFFKEYIYPALYKDDAVFEVSGYIPKNSYTDRLYSDFFDMLIGIDVNDLRFSDTNEYPADMYDCNNGEYYKYTLSRDFHGDSSLSYSDDRNVYYIVNYATCSSADEIAQVVKSCNLGKVVGTNTEGEGLIFGVCCDWMPNSLLMYIYSPSYVVDADGFDNSLYGTQPDIYGGVTFDGSLRCDAIAAEGKDWSSLQSRRIWDNNYQLILKDIGVLENAA